MTLLATPEFSGFLTKEQKENDRNRIKSIQRPLLDIPITDDNGELYFLPQSFTLPPGKFKINGQLHPLCITGTLRNGERASIFLADPKLFFVDVVIGTDELLTKTLMLDCCQGVLSIEKMEGHYINNGFDGKDRKWFRIYFTSLSNRRNSIERLNECQRISACIASNITESRYNRDITMVCAKNNIVTSKWIKVTSYDVSSRNITKYNKEYIVHNKDNMVPIKDDELEIYKLDGVSVAMVYDIECYGGNLKGDFPNPDYPEDVITAIAITMARENGEILAKYILALAPIALETEYAETFVFTSEMELLRAFFYIYDKWQPEWIVDFNGLSFDQRWILSRFVSRYEMREYILRAYSIWREHFISPAFLPSNGESIEKNMRRSVKLEAQHQQKSYVLKPEGAASILDVFLYLKRLTATLDLPGRRLNDYLDHYKIPLKDDMKYSYINDIFRRIVGLTAIMKMKDYKYSEKPHPRYEIGHLSYISDRMFNRKKYKKPEDIIKELFDERERIIYKDKLKDEEKYRNLVQTMIDISPYLMEERTFEEGVLKENDLVLHYNYRDTTTLFELCMRVNIFSNLRIQSTFSYVSLYDKFIRGETYSVISKQYNCMEALKMTSRTLNVEDNTRKNDIHTNVAKRGGKVFPMMYTKTGVITDPVIITDVKSFYPSIQHELDISPDAEMTGLPPQHITDKYPTVQIISQTKDIEEMEPEHYNFGADNPNYITTFVRTRKSMCSQIQKSNKIQRAGVKKLMKKIAGDESQKVLYNIYDQIQLAIKINSNSNYGFNSSDKMTENGAHSVFVADGITTIAGYLINAVAKMVFNDFGAVIVGGDTDSIFIILPRYMYEEYFGVDYTTLFETRYEELCNLAEVFGEMVNNRINDFLEEVVNGRDIEMELDDIPVGFPMFPFQKKIYVIQNPKITKKKIIRDEETGEEYETVVHTRKERGLAIRRRGTSGLEKKFIIMAIDRIMKYDTKVNVKEIIFELLEHFYHSELDIDLVKKSRMFKPEVTENKLVNAFVNRMKMMQESGADREIFYVPLPNERFETGTVKRGIRKLTLACTIKNVNEGDKIEYVHAIKKMNMQLDKNYYIFVMLVSRAAQFLRYDYPDMEPEPIKRAITKELRSRLGVMLEPPKLLQKDKARIKVALKELVETFIDEEFINLVGILLQERFPTELVAVIDNIVKDSQFTPRELPGALNIAKKSKSELYIYKTELFSKTKRETLRPFVSLISNLYYMLDYSLNESLEDRGWDADRTIDDIKTFASQQRFIDLKTKINDELDKSEINLNLKRLSFTKYLIYRT